MAIVRLIAPFGNYSGKVGAPSSQDTSSAVVTMPDKNGRTLARRFVNPNQPDSTYQQDARALLTTIAEAIQTLSLPQVEAWQAIAQDIIRSGRLGLDYALSWTMLFQMVNSYRQQDGQAIVLDPPELDSVSGASGVAVTSDDADPIQELSFDILAVAQANRKFQIRITRNLGSPVRQARTNELRYQNTPANCIVGAVGANPQIALASSRINVYSGQWIGVSILTITPNYYPAARYFDTNVLVGSL